MYKIGGLIMSSYAIVMCEKRKLFRAVQVEEVVNELKIKIPHFSEKKELKYGKKVDKILRRHRVSNVVLSNELKEKEKFCDFLTSQNHYMITGNKMYQALMKLVLEDICNMINVPMPSVSVAILSHEFSIENLDLVKYISKEIREVVVVSEQKERFEKILENFLVDEGIAIRVLENKNSNISHYPIVFNLDYSEEEVNQFILSKTAIVISIQKPITALRKSFHGILLNDIDIYLGKETKDFRTLALSEAYLYQYRRKIQENEKEFVKSPYRINGYIGNNGKIAEDDFQRVGKSFTKKSKK